MNKRLALPLILAVFIALPATRWITLSVLTDAFFQVAAFVFATLAIYYSLSSRISEHAISRFLSRHPAAEELVSIESSSSHAELADDFLMNLFTKNENISADSRLILLTSS